MKYYYKMLFKMYRYMLENYSRDEFLCETRKGIYKLVLKTLQKHFGIEDHLVHWQLQYCLFKM